MLRDCLAAGDGARGWRIEADPVLERGGCLVTTAQSQVDGRLETRLARSIATLFEDQRQEAGSAGDDHGPTAHHDAGH